MRSRLYLIFGAAGAMLVIFTVYLLTLKTDAPLGGPAPSLNGLELAKSDAAAEAPAAPHWADAQPVQPAEAAAPRQPAAQAATPGGEEAVATSSADTEDDAPVELPIVLAPPDPDWQMTEEEEATYRRLQQQFVNAIGGENQNPADPDYLKRWRAAQTLSDAMFKQQFGGQAYMEERRRAQAAGEQ
jgi:hypothetical protein